MLNITSQIVIDRFADRGRKVTGNGEAKIWFQLLLTRSPMHHVVEAIARRHEAWKPAMSAFDAGCPVNPGTHVPRTTYGQHTSHLAETQIG